MTGRCGFCQWLRIVTAGGGGALAGFAVARKLAASPDMALLLAALAMLLSLALTRAWWR